MKKNEIKFLKIIQTDYDSTGNKFIQIGNIIAKYEAKKQKKKEKKAVQVANKYISLADDKEFVTKIHNFEIKVEELIKTLEESTKEGFCFLGEEKAKQKTINEFLKDSINGMGTVITSHQTFIEKQQELNKNFNERIDKLGETKPQEIKIECRTCKYSLRIKANRPCGEVIGKCRNFSKWELFETL